MVVGARVDKKWAQLEVFCFSFLIGQLTDESQKEVCS